MGNIEDNRLPFKIISKVKNTRNECSFVNNKCEWNQRNVMGESMKQTMGCSMKF